MMGKTHAAAGALFATAFSPPTAELLGKDMGPEEILLAAALGTVAGLLPDIDHPKSMIVAGVVPGAKYLGPVGPVLGWALSLPPRLVGAGARTKLKHRGGTHSAVFMVMWTVLAAPLYAGVAALIALVVSMILGILAAILPIVPEWDIAGFVSWLAAATWKAMPLVMVSVFWGYLSHLLTDSMTNVPVPWPWPFSKKRFSILPKGLRIRTDSFTEKALIRPLIFMALLLSLFFYVALPIIDNGLGSSPEEDKREARKEQIEKKKGPLGGETPTFE